MEKDISIKLFQERCQEWKRVTDLNVIFRLHPMDCLWNILMFGTNF